MSVAERWQQVQALDTVERERIAFLNNAPLPKNDPALLRLVRCRVLRPFHIAARRVEPGAIVELAEHDARSLAALGRVELLD